MNICESSVDQMVEAYHYPVMYREILEFLDIKNKKAIIDCTVGIGSHARKILEVTTSNSIFVGIDRDQSSLDIAQQRLKAFEGRFTLIKDNFANLGKVLEHLDMQSIDVFLFDLGISSYQLSDSQRGFSFLKEGPLDMRMDNSAFLCGYDLVNNLSDGELENIFRKFGEERYSRRIAQSLVETRRREPIASTTQLAEIITNAVPSRGRYGNIHPATRVFQALRIVVNRELEALEAGLVDAISLLNKGGRIGVISFHSLEDRIVKHIFKNYSSQGLLEVITKKPLRPTDEEKDENFSSRSAKLRVAEKK